MLPFYDPVESDYVVWSLFEKGIVKLTSKGKVAYYEWTFFGREADIKLEFSTFWILDWNR